MSSSICDVRAPHGEPVRRRATRRFAGLLGLVAGVLMASTAAATEVTFRYQPVIGGVSSVAVAGTFNGWDAAANPMTDADEDGIWELTLDLDPGRHEYKWVVNGDQWFTDEAAAEFSSDGLGGQNSILTLKDEAVVVGLGTTVEKIEAPRAGLHRVAFKYRPQGAPSTISLAGTFNDWTIGKTPLADADGDGEWTATLLLPAGDHLYKFVVDDNQWTPDPEGQDSDVDDGFGGKNSIIRVDDRFPSIEVKRGDGDIFQDGVSHEQGSNEINNLGGGRVQFTARAHRGDIDGVDLCVYAGGKEQITPMKWTNRDQVYDYYQVEASLPAGETPYALRYRDGESSHYLTPRGFGEAPGDDLFSFSEARFPAFVTPQWVKDAVIYQIFPERFRNGDPSNDPDFSEWYYEGKTKLPPGGKLNPEFQEYYHLVDDWYAHEGLTQAGHTPDGRDWMSFYGGDIEGVRQGLDYLAELGVTAIYFNPLFQAKSNHKYDGADYMKVDPHFGTNEDFKQFVQEAHAKGIRIILDIVYNHSGSGHWAFKDAVEKGPKSPYFNWFEFKQWPLPPAWPNVGRPWKPADYYYCWWGFGDLPDLNFDLSRNNDAEKAIKNIEDAQVNIGLIKHLLDATEFWLADMDCDGVRLDVPNEVPYWFWKLYNQKVKSVKPDAYIVGELWGNAADHVKPGVYDAVMNYAFFRDPVTRFLGTGQGTAAEFDATLATGRLTYPSQAVEVQMNLIDSHDTVRFLTQVGGNVNRLKLAAMFGMTYIGAPHIYYGDEIGMEGGRDPDCRRPFLWNYADDPKRVALLDYYKRLTATRHAHKALRTGTFRTVHAEGMTFGYVRSNEDETFLVALNAGRSDTEMPFHAAAFGKNVKATDVMAGTTANWSGTVNVSLPAETGRIFKLERDDSVGAKE